MNPFEMVLGIIIVITIGRVLQARYGIGRDRHGNSISLRDDSAIAAENSRLKTELTTLKDRVAVLERVITDNESSLRLDHEIEKLREPRP